ncbi:EAL domain-containing protein [Aliiglaciecola sp. 3_MG-2023]|uniref:putative bifunctional diguanylate cyclase/phosphodiesterase n=1 Tax=Aliiglaciecola sp. 3_MG-2023 TaxID=3062644 RepID=UPI0026E4596A|nr:EAL domain-containing protein [Aliiglaciecola sp. 3_MG-2023]MDO6691669.1 EAL domain-containing protein [Aliiglaciecola sp. 3_MG-2023]
MISNLLLFGGLSLIAVAVLAALVFPRLRNLRLAKSLALYSLHTESLIILLNKKGQVDFINSSASLFLQKHGLSGDNGQGLLPENLHFHQQNALAEKSHHQHFEVEIQQHNFACELIWHAENKLWTLSLVDVSEYKLNQQKHRSQIQVNPDTGFDNHYAFKEIIEQMVNEKSNFIVGQLEIRSYSKLLADDDIETNRRVLKQLATLLKQTCLKTGLNIRLFQLSEKRFGIILADNNRHHTVENLVTTINTQVEKTQFSGQHSLQLDYGFTHFPSDGSSAEDIIRNTRIALENSASQEFSDYMMFNNELGQSVNRQNTLQDAMRTALTSNHFQLFFQPQYSLKDKKVIGAEVLIRWQFEEQWISPSEFIPLAEHSGLILPLGDWILASVCHKAKHMLTEGYEDIVIAVNISPKQFSAPNFVKMVQHALLASGLPAKNLELEITEGVLFNIDTEAISTLNLLNEMGIKLAIDDFGTGYSSLSYLQAFPVSKLKIDQSFVRNMHLNKADKSIVKSVIELGNELGVTLIAEGVEQNEQVELLTQMGCDEIQGYWLSKPLDESYFSHFLHSNHCVS